MGQRADEMTYRTEGGIDQPEGEVIIRETETTIAGGDVDGTEEIREEIEETRASLAETIDALTQRLSPDNLKEQVREQVVEQVQGAKEAVREATIGKAEDMAYSAADTVNRARYTIMDTIRSNPIPAAMAGIGLGWLYMNRRGGAPRYQTVYPYSGGYGRGVSYQGQRGYQGRSPVGETVERAGHLAGQIQDTAGNVASRVQDTAGNVASQVQDTAGAVANQVQDTAGAVVDRVQDTAGQLVDQAQYQTQRLEERFQELLYQRPLAVGAMTLALGTAVGLAVPETRQEHALMGETRDNLVEQAQAAASNTMEKVQRVASEVADEAKSTAREEAQRQGLAS